MVTIKRYIGRFAPSPSGPLHLGSLCCALASYLDAKANHGTWLVRIEDIDPPREQPGADQLILKCLQAHGLHWDEDVRYQSQQSKAYEQALASLRSQALSYRCDCTRKRLNSLNGRYDGHCLSVAPDEKTPCAIRLNTSAALQHNSHSNIQFNDLIQGQISEDFQQSGDFVIHRKDGLFAYQLAVSFDDVDQHITHIVRGCDLLETTPKQILLIKLLGGTPPSYAHIPVLASEPGMKLSKQNHAAAVDHHNALSNLNKACIALGMPPPKDITQIEHLLTWATEHWRPETLFQQREVLEGCLV